ncbi:hypothetical protein H5410_002696 [Solanum commersonii]|uniref:Transposase MuDR plant domain-containing protein n=1 Tax=Solanum commersonii TaxID=4109 RepID=A0A9J6B2Z7_SOLCO|nr:hypothetical protein H5410_002696 [Solanum commersonii]
MEGLFVGIDCRGEWVEKKNQYIWRWKDGKKRGGSVGMTVERNILYDDFVNLVMEKCGYNCQRKYLVMSYLPHFFHNEKVLPFKITDQPSFVVYLGRADRPSIVRVYVDENPIEEDHNLEEDQQDMLNDEFDDVDMNNHDTEIGKYDVPNFESHNPPTPIVGSNIPCSSQSSRVNNVRDDETGFYKGMTFKNKEELANSLKIVCLKKDFRLKKIYKDAEHAKSNVRGTHEHGYAVLNAYPKAYDRCEFNEHFNQIRDLVPKAAETLERIGFHTWSRAFCLGNRYNIMTSNIAESVNSMFDIEREFPIVSLFDEINRRFSLLFHQRRMELVNSANRFVPSIEKDISKYVNAGNKLLSHQIANYKFSIIGHGDIATVDLQRRTCTSRIF